MTPKILDEFGRPAQTASNLVASAMESASAEMDRVLASAICRRDPQLLDQFGRNILPPDPRSLAGWQEILANPDAHSWTGSPYAKELSYAPRFSSVTVSEEKGQ